ncbi:hypothetical protein Adt_33264 [Abeliophyllum distichum]|uniref:Uncharacterized protein n=1 Tax=Abeliophyllum distichum TaxID=126358 RepID=A0ABD1QVX1_9LAMI
MSFGSDDSQNWSDVQTNSSIQGESPLSSSSSEVFREVNQASPASCPSNPSASGREVYPTVPLKKVGGRKRKDAGVPEMRGSLDKKDAPAARALDEELRRSATEALMARSRITAEEFEDLRLSYDILSSVSLRAPGPAMQQGLRLPMHPFFRKVGGHLTPREFESIYRPYRSSGYYNVSPWLGQKWGTATDSPNKVHNWKERFFFVGRDWEFMLEDPHPHVSIPRRFGELNCGKPPIPKRNQGELRSKWDKVRALSSEFRSLNNLLKDDNLLASCGLMAFRFKGVPMIRLIRPASGEGSSAQASRHEASGPSQEAQDAAPSSTILPPRPEVDSNILQRSLSSSNLHIDSTTLRNKGKKVVEGTEEALYQKRKAPAATEGLMRDARKARRTEEGRRSSHLWTENQREPEILRPQLAKIVASLVKVNLVQGLVLSKDIFSAFASFDAEDSKSKNIAEDLKAQDQRRAAEASQKRAEEAQKLAEDRTLAAETTLAAANGSLEAAAVDNERSLIATKLELEKIKAERADTKARAVEAYQDVFVDTPEY